MKKFFKWGAFTTLVLCGACHAQSMSGHQLYNWITGTTTSAQTVALAYITGVTDMGASLPGRRSYCLPSNGNNAQFADVVKKYLLEKPEERHKDAPEIIVAALTRAFPCG